MPSTAVWWGDEENDVERLHRKHVVCAEVQSGVRLWDGLDALGW